MTDGRTPPAPAPESPAPALAWLRKLVRRPEPEERCELCSAPLAQHPNHEHLLDTGQRQVQCSCTACATLFPADARKRFLRIPRQVCRFDGFRMSDEQWHLLAIPVQMAFLQTTLEGEARAYYPSPGGAVEAALQDDAWQQIAGDNPALTRMQPAVEALLINRIGDARDAYLAPVDRCYELVGLIRLNWRGLSGGLEVWRRVDEFFSALGAVAAPLAANPHA